MKTILFYDGQCGFCDYVVQFILKNEKSNDMMFARLQSSFAEELFRKHSLTNDFSTMVLFNEGKLYLKSSAFQIILSKLRFPYTFFSILMRIFPKNVLDFFYSIVSRYRRKIVNQASCKLLKNEDQIRFIS
jgi:predicted DCC family thiol-disulfide oxidoreductase YuxK